MLHRTFLPAALLLALVAAAPADQKPAAGSAKLTGTVLNSSGTALEGVSVRLLIDEGDQQSRGGVTSGKSIVGTPAPRPLAKGTPVATVRTDAKGKFEAKNLKPGNYTYRAGDPTTVGFAMGTVVLEKDKTADVEIKLKPPVKR